MYNIHKHSTAQHSTASSARNPFTYSAKMLLAALLHSGRRRRQACSTLILRFSRGLGYKTLRENWKSSNNRPPSPPNQSFSIFSAFLFFAETLWYQLLHFFPFNFLNVLQLGWNNCSSCPTVLMLLSNWRVRVIYFYSWGELKSLRNREKRGMTVLCSKSVALKHDRLL
jgi:hypothetical protein